MVDPPDWNSLENVIKQEMFDTVSRSDAAKKFIRRISMISAVLLASYFAFNAYKYAVKYFEGNNQKKYGCVEQMQNQDAFNYLGKAMIDNSAMFS